MFGPQNSTAPLNEDPPNFIQYLGFKGKPSGLDHTAQTTAHRKYGLPKGMSIIGP